MQKEKKNEASRPQSEEEGRDGEATAAEPEEKRKERKQKEGLLQEQEKSPKGTEGGSLSARTTECKMVPGRCALREDLEKSLRFASHWQLGGRE